MALTELERDREKRMAENKKRLAEMGLDDIARFDLLMKEAKKQKTDPNPRPKVARTPVAEADRRRSSRIAQIPAPLYNLEEVDRSIRSQIVSEDRAAKRAKSGAARVGGSGGSRGGWHPDLGDCSLQAAEAATEAAVKLQKELEEKGKLAAAKLMSYSQVAPTFWMELPRGFAHAFRPRMHKGYIELVSDARPVMEDGTTPEFRNLKDVRNGVPAEQQRKDVWRVVFQPRAEGRDKGAGLSGGWAGFTKDQRLFPSDTVVFEKESDVRMRAHVFRGADYETEATIIHALPARIPSLKGIRRTDASIGGGSGGNPASSMGPDEEAPARHGSDEEEGEGSEEGCGSDVGPGSSREGPPNDGREGSDGEGEGGMEEEGDAAAGRKARAKIDAGRRKELAARMKGHQGARQRGSGRDSGGSGKRKRMVEEVVEEDGGGRDVRGPAGDQDGRRRRVSAAAAAPVAAKKLPAKTSSGKAALGRKAKASGKAAAAAGGTSKAAAAGGGSKAARTAGSSKVAAASGSTKAARAGDSSKAAAAGGSKEQRAKGSGGDGKGRRDQGGVAGYLGASVEEQAEADRSWAAGEEVSLPPPNPLPPKTKAEIRREENSDGKYYVRRILGYKLEDGERKFLINWWYFSDAWNTWEPRANLDNHPAECSWALPMPCTVRDTE